MLVILVIALFSINISISGQDSEFLISTGKDIKWGGFGGAELKFSELVGSYGTYTGIKAGVVMNNLVIGAAGGAFLSKHVFEGMGTTEEIVDLSPSVAYGGLYSEYFLMRNKPVHFSGSVVVGPGAAWLFEQGVTGSGMEDDNMVEFGGFLVIEPAINIELNVINPMKLFVTAGYRIVTADDFDRLDNADLSGLSLGFGLRLGKY